MSGKSGEWHLKISSEAPSQPKTTTESSSAPTYSSIWTLPIDGDLFYAHHKRQWRWKTGKTLIIGRGCGGWCLVLLINTCIFISPPFLTTASSRLDSIVLCWRGGGGGMSGSITVLNEWLVFLFRHGLSWVSRAVTFLQLHNPGTDTGGVNNWFEEHLTFSTN